MTTKAENILSYVETLLANTSGVTNKVWRDRPSNVMDSEIPALLLEKINATATYTNLNYIDWNLKFRVAIFTRGAGAATLADPIEESMYGLLMADRTLGGRVFDILPVSSDFKLVDGNKPIGITDYIFAVTHRTDASDISTYTS